LGRDIFAQKGMYEKLIKCAAKTVLCFLKRFKKRVLKFKTISHTHEEQNTVKK